MKVQSLFIITAVVTLFTASCKKNNEGSNDDVSAQIQNILPQKYIDSLKAHGFVINEGKTPPVINNVYEFEPVNDYDNSGIFSPGQSATINMKIKIQNQVGNNADVYTKGFISATTIDTSSAKIIAGSGNDFTIYAQSKGGTPKYTYDYVMTGTLSGAGFVNVKFAFVMIDNGGNGAAATTGTIRIFHDKDLTAKITTTFRSMLTQSKGDIGIGGLH